MKKVIYFLLLVSSHLHGIRPVAGSSWADVTYEFKQQLDELKDELKFPTQAITLVTKKGDIAVAETIGVLVINKKEQSVAQKFSSYFVRAKSDYPLAAFENPAHASYQAFQNFLINAGPLIPLSPSQKADLKNKQLARIQYLRTQQFEAIKKLNTYDNALLLTVNVTDESQEKSLGQLIDILNRLYTKKNVATRFVIIAYAESAPAVNRASRYFNLPINLLLYVQSPIYEWKWNPINGYMQDINQTPTNFIKLINIYSKAENPVFDIVTYPDRKYRAQINTMSAISKFQVSHALENRVYNVRALKINAQGAIEDVNRADLTTPLFISKLPWLLQELNKYKLNIDLAAVMWSGDKNKPDFQSGLFVNRFINTNPNGDIILSYGDGKGQEYTLVNKKDLKISSSELKKQFGTELQLSSSQLKNILDKPVLEGWVPAYLGGSALANDLNRLKQQHRSALSSALHINYNPEDLLGNAAQLLPELLKQLGDPVSLSFAIKNIIEGGDYLYQILYNNLEKTIPVKTQEEYLNSIISVIWSLYGSALTKQQGFTEGTFVIQDTDFKLYNFLMGYVKKVNPQITGTITDPASTSSNNPFAYSRISSHYKDEQKKFRQYGIDVRYDKNSAALALLPIGKRHIVFGKIEDAQNRNLIYIKPENYGIYSTYEKAMHGKEFVQAQSVKMLPKFKNLLREDIFNTLQEYIGTDDDELFRKERVPQDFIVKFSEAIKPFCTTPQERKEYLTQAAKQGIKVSVSRKMPKNIIEQLGREFDALYDYTDLRSGREVILTHDELGYSLYYHLLLTGNAAASRVKTIFDQLIRAKNIILQLKRAKYKSDTAANNRLLGELRIIAQALETADLGIIEQFSPSIYTYVSNVVTILSKEIARDPELSYKRLTGGGTIFDSRSWRKQDVK
ncbi:hypothetical protein Noda2021_08800 [Candidatus Dependentiae bacterium Noda2021]|nr:hypothetical protein Noda2021_08800 [Candidatus Dependentiae bacterium Noda2021]